MKILVVHSSAELYGSDRCLLSLVAGVVERGHEVHVAVPGMGVLVDELTRAGARVHIMETLVFRRDLFSIRGVAKLFLGAPTAVWRLIKLIRSEKIDLVHTNTGVTIGGALAARLIGKPHIWHFRDILSEFKKSLRLFELIISFTTTRSIFITKAVRDQFRMQRLKDRGTVVYDGIDIGIFENIAPESIDGNLVVTTIGRLAPYKGQDVLLRSLAEVAKRGINVDAWVVGDVYGGRHAFRESLVALAETLEISGNVHFVGFQEEIRPYLERCNLFVMPSVRQEPLGIVMLEAMAAGRAVIASRGGGVGEIIEDGVNGILFEPGDIVGLSRAIVTLAPDIARRRELADMGRNIVKARFSETVMVDKVLALYEEVLQDRGHERSANKSESLNL